MKSCYEAGCPFADKITGTCKDESCLAHPKNTCIVARKQHLREGAEEQIKSMPLDSQSASRVQTPLPLSQDLAINVYA